MTGNCIGWVAYSIITNDPFILVGNAPGLVISIWLNFGATKLQYPCVQQYSPLQKEGVINDENDVIIEDDEEENNNRQQRQNIEQQPGAFTPHEKVVICIVIFWLVLLTVCSFIPISKYMMKFIIGLVTNVNSVAFYGAPLSTIYTVTKMKNSASIHRPTLVTFLLNSFFWTVYGIAILDIWIAVPNGIGLGLSLVQFILCLVFKQKEDEATSKDDKNKTDGRGVIDFPIKETN